MKPRNKLRKWIWGVLIVVILLLVLGGVFLAQSGRDSSRKSITQGDLSQLSSACQAYVLEYGVNPPTDPKQLVVVLRGTALGEYNSRKIVFLEPRPPQESWLAALPGSVNAEDQFIDAWGHPYVFELDPATGRMEAWSRMEDQKADKATAQANGLRAILFKGKNP